jgi:predicted ArsR family transcriptional regulator
MEEKEKKRKAGPARNAKLAKELGISKKAAKKRRPKPK